MPLYITETPPAENARGQELLIAITVDDLEQFFADRYGDYWELPQVVRDRIVEAGKGWCHRYGEWGDGIEMEESVFKAANITVHCAYDGGILVVGTDPESEVVP